MNVSYLIGKEGGFTRQTNLRMTEDEMVFMQRLAAKNATTVNATVRAVFVLGLELAWGEAMAGGRLDEHIPNEDAEILGRRERG